MSRMPPMLSYYGAKYGAAPLYPKPLHRRIVEPFAGGASYSLLHVERDVLLVDKSEKLIAVWQFLIGASPADIMALPMLEPGQSVDDLAITQDRRWFIGWWANCAVATPVKRMSKWGLTARDTVGGRVEVWAPRCRARIAAAVPRIKHWRAVCASYETLDISEPATWFVDPPYQDKGVHYPHGARDIDFAHLGAWCRSLPGHVMVCENEGATWLPFEPFRVTPSQVKRNGRRSAEALWTNDGWRMPQQMRIGDV